MQNFYLNKNQIRENTDFWVQNSSDDWSRCIRDLITSRPFGDRKFYIFTIVKRVDDAAGIKKMIHQPRLTRPEPLHGTTLLKVDPDNPDEVLVVWTLPDEENISLYKFGKLFADEFVHSCIEKYLKRPKELMEPDPEDPNEEQMRQIYKEKLQDLRWSKKKAELWHPV